MSSLRRPAEPVRTQSDFVRSATRPALRLDTSPPEPAYEDKAGGTDDKEASASSGDLFERLKDIRALQSEIAAAHTRLERSTGEPGASAKEQKAGGDTYAAMGREFESRQKGIVDIMGKLDKLAQAVEDFHAIPSDELSSALGTGSAQTGRPQRPTHARSMSSPHASSAKTSA